MAFGGRGFDVQFDGDGERVIVPVDLPSTLPRRELRSVKPSEVRAAPGGIEWRTDALWNKWEPGAPGLECLFNFANLATATEPTQLAEFASVHGVLGRNSPPLTLSRDRSRPVPDDPGWYFESIETWVSYAKHAKLILVLAMAFRDDDNVASREVLRNAGFGPEVYSMGVKTTAPPPNEIIWIDPDTISAFGSVPLLPPNVALDEENPTFMSTHAIQMLNFSPSTPLARKRSNLGEWIQRVWLNESDIRPRVDWTDGPARLVLESHRGDVRDMKLDPFIPVNSLFDVLAAEIAGFVCSDQHIGHCARCSALHASKIKVRTDQPNYCSDCRVAVRRATNRDAARRRYALQKAENAANVDTRSDTLAGGQTKTERD